MLAPSFHRRWRNALLTRPQAKAISGPGLATPAIERVTGAGGVALTIPCSNPKKVEFLMRATLLAFLGCFLIALAGCGQPQVDTTASSLSEETLYLHLKTGKVVIKMRPDLAPKHVARVTKLVKEGFYDGLKFHRVIDGFMAQTGDPSGTGMGGSKYGDLAAEFTHTQFKRGTIGAARTNNPHSANSQFFICFAPSPFLNGKYTVWGEVVSGMEHVDQIAKGEPPAKPDVIVKMTFDPNAA